MVNPVTELRKRLKKDGLSQAALAARLGLSEPYISMVLSGRRPPTEPLLRFLGLERCTRVIYRKRAVTKA